MKPDASPPRPPTEAASGSTSGSRVLGEFGLAVGALLITLIVVTGLALLLTPFGIEKPGKIARKLTVPLFIIIYMVFTRLRLRSLPRLTTLVPLPLRPVSSVLKGFAAGAAALALLILIQFLPGWREVRRCQS